MPKYTNKFVDGKKVNISIILKIFYCQQNLIRSDYLDETLHNKNEEPPILWVTGSKKNIKY